MWKLFKQSSKKKQIFSAADGNILPLCEVKDEVFSSGNMGEGFAIDFQGTKIVSPISGIIEACFPSGHALGIRSESSDVIVHVGIDTVELKGEGFQMHVQAGDVVEKGDLLIEVDASYLRSKGYDATTMVIFTTGENLCIEKMNVCVKAGEEIGYVR